MAVDHPGSFPLGRVGGVGIFIHWSWMIITVLLVLGFWGQVTAEYPDLDNGAAWGLALVGSILFFGSVLVHELAHAFVARVRGIEVKGITLYMFGGATEADASSRSATDEFVIAIVGPLTSVFVAAVFGSAALLLGSGPEAVAGLVGYLALVNLLLAVFNMTPGLPLDGGRVFRSIVWAVTGDFQKATRWATSAGVAVGYVLIGGGILAWSQGAIGGLWFAAIGWMISQSAKRSEQQEQVRETFKSLVAGEVMTSPVLAIPSQSTVEEAVETHFARQDHLVFPVVERDRIVGMLSLSAISRLARPARLTTAAGQLATAVDPKLIVSPTTPMLEVIDALSSAPSKGRALVVDDGVLTGIISPSDVIRRSALAALLDPGGAEPEEPSTGTDVRP